MSTWEYLGYGLLGIGVCFLLYRLIKYSPGSFTKENFSKTARTLGLLAIFLIVIIGFCVLMLRN